MGLNADVYGMVLCPYHDGVRAKYLVLDQSIPLRFIFFLNKKLTVTGILA
jgi:hypothetical protein